MESENYFTIEYHEMFFAKLIYQESFFVVK